MDAEAIRAAVVGGWCVPPNTAKEMDVDLAEAIVQQLLPVFSDAVEAAVREAARVADAAYAEGKMGNPGHHILMGVRPA